MGTKDWITWHHDYDGETPHARRLVIVQRLIGSFVSSSAPGVVRLISMCAGDGRDVIGALSDHPRRSDVRGLLVELDATLAQRARAAAGTAGLEVAVREVDAGRATAYEGGVPADLVLVCGVFGNIADVDVEGTIRALPSLCADGARVIWTRHRRPPDLTPAIRRWFAEVGFAELAFEPVPDSPATVGAHRLLAPALPFAPEVRLFDFEADR